MVREYTALVEGHLASRSGTIDAPLGRDHRAPQILKHRGAQTRPGRYFGPFASAGAVNRTITALQRAFPFESNQAGAVRFRVRPNDGATGGQLRLTVQRAGAATSYRPDATCSSPIRACCRRRRRAISAALPPTR